MIRLTEHSFYQWEAEVVVTTSTLDVGVTFGPTNDVHEVFAATRRAEELGLDAVGCWDHYHSEKPDWEMVSGWSTYGYLAAITTHIKLVPMVLCRPNHLLGVLAKESSMLQLASNGRFELGIGAGDYPVEFTAWNVPFAPSSERIELLTESIAALREIWKGDLVTFIGNQIQLVNAGCTPVALVPPRVVAGVGSAHRMIEAVASWADEINVYEKDVSFDQARTALATAGRPDVPVSVFAHREWDRLPDDLPGRLRRWHERGANRYFVTVGWADDLMARVEEIASARAEAFG
jgi:alkanesulfonate monooxygenase SsuD/methylene tetrahydromethanopterin reductase-like flavin-dependent oxidoreductase (luciferase family)